MDDSTPHLSIVIPLYNAGATLPALYQKISALTVQGHELIIVNDLGIGEKPQSVVRERFSFSRTDPTLS